MGTTCGKDTTTAMATMPPMSMSKSDHRLLTTNGINKNNKLYLSFSWFYRPGDVKLVGEYLHSQNFDVFYEMEGIYSDFGQQQRLQKILDSDLVVVFFSETYAEPESDTMRELAFAINNEKPLLLVRLDGDYVPEGVFGAAISGLVWLEYDSSDLVSLVGAEICKEIGKLLHVTINVKQTTKFNKQPKADIPPFGDITNLPAVHSRLRATKINIRQEVIESQLASETAGNVLFCLGSNASIVSDLPILIGTTAGEQISMDDNKSNALLFPDCIDDDWNDVRLFRQTEVSTISEEGFSLREDSISNCCQVVEDNNSKESSEKCNLEDSTGQQHNNHQPEEKTTDREMNSSVLATDEESSSRSDDDNESLATVCQLVVDNHESQLDSHHQMSSTTSSGEMNYDEIGLAEILTENGVEFRKASKYWSRMKTACENGQLDLVRYLVEQDPNVVSQIDADGWTPMMSACRSGRLDVVRFLAERDEMLVSRDNEDGWTPMLSASESGHLDVVKFLAEKDATAVTQRDCDGWSPLMAACRNGHLGVAKFLVEEDLRCVTQKNNDGWTAMMSACRNGHLEVVKLLAAKDGKSLMQANKNGWTPIMFARENGHSDVVRFLEGNEDLCKVVTTVTTMDGHLVSRLTTE